MPVLWITGPAGVGKSTVSWQLFTELAGEGVHVAFADTDQFCMCYPAPPDDPERERIKAQNLGALVPRYHAAGAGCVIANGVLDAHRGVYAALMPEAAVTVCRLRADRAEVARRYRAKHRSGDDLKQRLARSLDEVDALDASTFADVWLDTTDLTAPEVARLVREHCRDWPGFRQPRPENRLEPPKLSAGAAGGRILLICGPTGVGKSTVGFQFFLQLRQAGLAAGYVDLEQIGFVRPGSPDDPGGHRLKAGNLAAMWHSYYAAGARYLIAVGRLESQAALEIYRNALPEAAVTACRLHAGPLELTRRILSRREGGSWPEPGDPLRGQPVEYLQRVAERATIDAYALERGGLGTIRIATDGRTVAETVELLATATNFGGVLGG